MNTKFDFPSFWAGIFVAILFFALTLSLVVDRLTIVPNACQYAEDLCYSEYENGKWTIVEGERK
jgi:hypothetical protein